MNSPCVTGLVTWKVKPVPGKTNHPREIPGGQAGSQASCRLVQRGTVTRRRLSWWTAFPSHAQDLPAVALAVLALDGGQSDGWHRFAAPLVPRIKRSDFFLPLQSPGISFSEVKTSPLLARFLPKRSWESSWLLENIWERGREGAVKWQALSAPWGKPCLAAQDRRTNQCHGTGRLGKSHRGSGSFWPACLPVCLSVLSIPPAWPELQLPPALGSPGISDPGCLCFWPTTEDFSWLHFLDFGSYGRFSSSFQYRREKVGEAREWSYI